MSERPIDRDQAEPAAADEQSEVIRFLSNPSSYEPPVSSVQCIETHGALVFLAGNRALKLKRAIKFPYLDFSTVARRAAACHHEIERNQPAAPGIYIAAEPILRDPTGGLFLSSAGVDEGSPVDWVVVMNRFEQADLLDHLARNQRLSIDLMPPLADSIAAYHASARIDRGSDGHDLLAKVVTQTIMALFESGEWLPHSEVDAYARRIVAALNSNAQLLRTRARQGHVRLCHGDLHLRNIVLQNGRPTLFDAIEFDDALARTDVLYDLAFLLMDLCHRGLRHHANLCFNTYIAKSVANDALSGLAVLPVFLATRAAIRAMVAIDKAAIAVGTNTRSEIQAEIDAYFADARQFLEGGAPVLIAIGGYSGTGKSTLAAALAPEIGRAPGALHLRSDVERKRMVGIDPLERLPRHGYSQSTSAKVYKHLCARTEQALRAGHSVIVDATFLEAAHRRQIERVAARAHVRFTGVWLDAAPDYLVERVSKRRNDASDADAAVVMAQLSTHSACTCWETIDTGGDFDRVLARATVAVRNDRRHAE